MPHPVRWIASRTARHRLPDESDSRGGPADSDLVRYCEHLLAGTAIDLFFAGREVIPDWAWINTLAHASPEVLAGVAHRYTPVDKLHPEARAWELTLSLLAGSLLDRSRDLGVSVEDLQRRVLIPIELDRASNPVGPSTLVRMVLTRLAEMSLSGA